MPTAISIATTNVAMRSGSTSPNVGITRIGSGGVPRQPGHREASDELADLGADPVVDVRVVTVTERVDDHPPDLAHLVRAEATRRRRRCPDPDATRDVRRVDVERDRVLVHGDAHVVEQRLGLTTGDTERRDVDEREVVVGATADQPGAGIGDGLREDLRVLDRPGLVAPEVVLEGELERDRLRGDHVHQRTALDAGEHALVDRLRERRLAEGREVGPVDALRADVGWGRAGRSAGWSHGGGSAVVSWIARGGPWSGLCVVGVPGCACGSGLGWSASATRAAKWARSTKSSARTRWAMAAIRS